MKIPTVYIMTNKPNGVLYTGVTAYLAQRVWQHRNGQGSQFAARYGCERLVWIEVQPDMPGAIAREKQIKGGSRAKKVALVEAANPGWRDLWPEAAGGQLRAIASPAARARNCLLRGMYIVFVPGYRDAGSGWPPRTCAVGPAVSQWGSLMQSTTPAVIMAVHPLPVIA